MSSEQEDPPREAAQQQSQHPDADTEMPDHHQDQQQQQPPPPPTSTTTETAAAAAEEEEPREQADEEPQEEEPQEEKPPPPPTPGPRAARLQTLFASTAKHTLDKISKENFEACFPTVAGRAPGTLEFVQRRMVERLGVLWGEEFETIMANRQVVARLNELEGLVGDAARRRAEAGRAGEPPIAPHTLPATTILHAHLHPHLTAHQSQLNAKLQNTQASNARLWDEIQAQRAEMEALLAGVEKVLRDVDGANALLGDVVDELAAETRAAEGDVRGAVVSGAAARAS
ncbi:Nnf1-domain-containing protein [Chaetomidium leptoderma]|uniref:Nnf1-domain-containing protein n=1 Tax=Chaetomidium leptoderma TaxID=669021 RepID=A0AAN7A0A2_9PEZI|nr:Nnf1-domain-containing protein [Chaetomidium leptoderma]